MSQSRLEDTRPKEVEANQITTGRCKAVLPDGRIQTVVYTCAPTGYKAVVQYQKAGNKSTAHERNASSHNHNNRNTTLPIKQVSTYEVNRTLDKAIIQQNESISTEKPEQLSTTTTTPTTAPIRAVTEHSASSSITPIVDVLPRRKQPDSIAQHRFVAAKYRPTLVQLQHSIPILSLPSVTTTPAPDTTTAESVSSTPTEQQSPAKKKTMWRI